MPGGSRLSCREGGVRFRPFEILLGGEAPSEKVRGFWRSLCTCCLIKDTIQIDFSFETYK